ncbi:PAAR domain-containing protein [Roseovarius ramblicola]|uniref:PAAR domain-containing protein n=1 Tax=Roseovarius ramblicola TaxID=2022336 RepID=A0ABV5HYM8_9RHOB
MARITQDSAGGTIVGDLVPTVKVNGTAVAVVGAAVASHGKAPHAAPVMAEGSGTVTAGGIALCREGDAASCGHVATGSGDVSAG